MNLIKPRYEFLSQRYEGDYSQLLDDMYKHIEICGRTCYNSLDHMTDDSYKKFVDNLIKSKHGAMLEHGTLYLTIPIGSPAEDNEYVMKHDLISFFKSNKYSKVNCKRERKDIDVNVDGFNTKTRIIADFYYVTTNFRVIIENSNKTIVDGDASGIDKYRLIDIIPEFMCTPTENHERRHTVKFVCGIDVTREFNRHRNNSMAEQSTRYCNYTKEKFQEGNGGLNVCEPVFLSDHDKGILHSDPDHLDFISLCEVIGRGKRVYEPVLEPIDYWIFANEAASFAYENLVSNGWKPQEARTILPLDIKSVLIHTAFDSDWKHFFNLRALGTTGAPHPSAKELALPLMIDFIGQGYINEKEFDQELLKKAMNEYMNPDKKIREDKGYARSQEVQSI